MSSGAGWVGLLGVLARLGGDALGLILPTQCAGCGAWDEALCPACAALAAGPAQEWTLLDTGGRSRHTLGGETTLPLIALGAYEGALRRIILAAKHSRRVEHSAFLHEAGRALGRALCAQGVPAPAVRLGPGAEVWVVPAPSSWKRRFFSHSVTIPLARGVASSLAEGLGVKVSVVEAVGLRPGAASQSGKAGRARAHGRRGSMRARVEVPEGYGLVLVDDVVTTGATARELVRCVDAPVWALLALAQA